MLVKVSQMIVRRPHKFEFRNNSPQKSQKEMPSSPWKTDGQYSGQDEGSERGLVRERALGAASKQVKGSGGQWMTGPSGKVAWVIWSLA